MERNQRIGLIVVALVVAVLAFVLLRPDDEDEDSKRAGTTTEETRPQEPTGTVPKRKPKPRFETIRVVGGKPAGGPKEITVDKGDVVRLAVEADQAGEVHVHGYDLMKDVAAGGPVRFRFKATIEGVFEIEIEETKTEIATLTVEP